MTEKLLTIREVAAILNTSEKEVIELSEKGVIPAYKVGGVYLRFKREQIEQIKGSFSSNNKNNLSNNPYNIGERLRDFFYFYDFYIISAVLILVLLGIIIKG